MEIHWNMLVLFAFIYRIFIIIIILIVFIIIYKIFIIIIYWIIYFF